MVVIAIATFENIDILLKYFGSLAEIGRYTLNTRQPMPKWTSYSSSKSSKNKRI
jgi:hypothetical protein